MTKLLYLKRSEIDTNRWDECIACSVNSLPYAYSWYLDAVAENWDALVTQDYRTVMPLVWMKKWGVKCLYQPNYCQQLGVFGSDMETTLLFDFMEAANQRFPYIHLQLHSLNALIATRYKCFSKTNLLLDLSPSYDVLKKEYADNHRRNIQKAKKLMLVFDGQTPLKAFSAFYLQNMQHSKEVFKPKHKKIFQQLTQTLTTNRCGKVFAVCDDKGNLLSAGMFVLHQKRIINIINTSSLKGKNTGAAHYLFDQVIAQFSGSQQILDFEGSSVPGIARFYLGFGAYNDPFFLYSANLVKRLRQRFW